jgi:hypothetical protein
METLDIFLARELKSIEEKSDPSLRMTLPSQCTSLLSWVTRLA